VEWVETTGRTLEDAKDAALDQLGVDESDAEFEVVDEPKSGLFGLTRREARFRALVRPTTPRPKIDRRDRRRRGSSGNGGSGRGSSAERGRKSGTKTKKAGSERVASNKSAGSSSTSADAPVDDQPSSARAPSRNRRSRPESAPSASSSTAAEPKGTPMSTDDVTVEEQASIISEFMEGLLEAYGLEGELTSEKIDDETIEIQIAGDDLGLLIGPKGQTLAAIQDLSRTVVQRQAAGTHHGRVRVDVGGYRQRRREALERFARSVAEDVKASGAQKSLEPMNAADRKVVHDTVNDIDGVATVSEGEDQRRRVVIIPAS
jgi:spoIIIJ-associated protein